MMNGFLKSERGAIALYILVILLIICLLLPVYALSLEKFAAQNNIDKIQDTITISVSSSYMALMPEFYTEAVLKLDKELFERKLKELLLRNLSREFPGIQIEEEEVFCEELPAQCSCDGVFNRPGVHLVVCVPIRYSAVRLLLPIKMEQLSKMTVHSDVFFTIEN